MNKHGLTVSQAVGQSVNTLSGIGPIAVLASGGVDSACLLEWAGVHTRGRVVPIYVSFGLKWEKHERRALKKFSRAVRRKNISDPVVLSLPMKDAYHGHWSLTGRGVPGRRSRDAAVYLPGRNLLLLAKAAVFCAQRGIETIAIGTLAANPFADATSGFFSRFSKLASFALGRPIQIVAPFRRLTKPDLLRRYAHLPLHLCFSCLNPRADSGKSCGRCNKCVEWRKARNITLPPLRGKLDGGFNPPTLPSPQGGRNFKAKARQTSLTRLTS